MNLKTKSVKMLIFVVVVMSMVSTSALAMDVYFSPDQIYTPDCGETIVEVRINATSNVSSVNSYVEYDPYCINITNVAFGSGWSSVGPDYYDGMIRFSCGRDPFTGDMPVVELTIECNGAECISPLNFTNDGSSYGQNVYSPDHGFPSTGYDNVTWADSTVQCVGCGDVDCGGSVSINDAVDTYKRVIDPYSPIEFEWAADVDSSQAITISDAVEIYRKVIDTSHTLNCAC